MSMTFAAFRQNPENQHFQPIFGFNCQGEDTLNVSNANGSDIVAALGYGAEQYAMGDFGDEIQPFIARCNAWLAGNSKADAAIAPSVSQVPGRIAIYDCGREAGYLQAKIEALLAIARRGQQAGATMILGG